RSSRRRARAKPRSQSNEAATGPPSVAGSIVSSASSTDSNAEVDNLSILFRPDASGYGDGSGENAEGEIRTPEGLAAHQISSLARWTGLRYLSERAITGTRKIPSLVIRGQAAGESRPTRRRRPAARECRLRGSSDGSRRNVRCPARGGQRRRLGPG